MSHAFKILIIKTKFLVIIILMVMIIIIVNTIIIVMMIIIMKSRKLSDINLVPHFGIFQFQMYH